MNLPALLVGGFVATALLTTMMSGANWIGFTRMSIPFLLGTMVTPGHDRALAIGTAVHFVNGWIFAAFYAAVFEVLGQATWWIGGFGGLLHGLFVLAVLTRVLPGVHPRMVSEYFGPTQNQQLQPPGPFALNYGPRTPVVALLAHVAYGLVLGTFYQPV